MIASIVLFHHVQLEIQRVIDNLLAASNTQKIILVDNGGCDWASELNHPKITYIKSPKNGGFGYGHNLAIQQYSKDSELFLICNPDIYFEPSEFDRLVSMVKIRKEGLFSPTICNPDGTNQYGQRLLPTPLNLFARRFLPSWADKLDEIYLLKNQPFDKPGFVPVCSGSFMLFRSQALLELGGFDDRYFMYLEDFDLSRRCASRFGNCYVPDVKIYHEHAQGSYKNKKLLKYHIQSTIKYFNKWGWLFDSERQILNRKTLESLQSEAN